MENVNEIKSFLSKLAHESKSKVRKQILKATEKQIKTLVEIILNFNQFDTKDCTKKLKTQAKKLKNKNWKIKTAKKVILKNLNVIKAIVSSVILCLINREVCEILKDGNI